MNAVKAQIDELTGGMEYKDGKWIGKTHIGDDGAVHFDSGDIAAWEHSAEFISKILNSGPLT